MVVARSALFAFFQALAVLVFLLAARVDPLDASAAWWPVTALLCWCGCSGWRRRYSDLVRIDRMNWRRDLLFLLGVLIITGPVAFLPNIGLSSALFGDARIAVAMFVRPHLMPYLVVVHGLMDAAIYFSV